MFFKHSVPILYAANVRRSLEYYTTVLGFENKWEWDDAPTFGGVSKDVVEIFFCEKGQGQPGTWLAIMVDDVDAFFENVKSRGAKILSEPGNKDWGLREMLVEDPDGHVLRIGQHFSTKPKSKPDGEIFQIVHRKPTVEEYAHLLQALGWDAKPEPLLQKILDAALHGVVAEDRDAQIIGHVLVLGDGVSFFYIKDLRVLPAWQGKGVGKAIMQQASRWMENNAEDEVLAGLYTGEGLAQFYREFGFRPSFGMIRHIKKGKADSGY